MTRTTNPELFFQLAFGGILLGLVYGLIGLGLSLSLGIMGVLNISHGTLYIMGGYLFFFVAEDLGLPVGLGVLIAVAATFLLGVVINLAFVEPVLNDPTSVMMTTFGLAIVLEQVILLLQGGVPIDPPALIKGNSIVGPFYFQNQILLAAATCVAVAFGTVLLLQRTRIGKAMRMLAQDRELASVVGVNVRRISAIALGIGSAFAGLAGVLLTPVYLDFPEAQWTPLVAAFVVVTIGGIGSVKGSIFAGLIYGFLEVIGSYFIPSGSDILALLMIIAIVLVRPTGLFGARERV